MSRCKFLSVLAAALFLAACVKIDPELGSSMVPVSSTYKTVTPAAIPIGVKQLMADSLSGFSNNGICFRQDIIKRLAFCKAVFKFLRFVF